MPAERERNNRDRELKGEIMHKLAFEVNSPFP